MAAGPSVAQIGQQFWTSIRAALNRDGSRMAALWGNEELMADGQEIADAFWQIHAAALKINEILIRNPPLAENCR